MNKNLEQSLSDGNRPQYRFMKYRIHKDFLCFFIFFLINIHNILHYRPPCLFGKVYSLNPTTNVASGFCIAINIVLLKL